MKMYVVEVIETAHWEFHIQADDEDEARNRVESALDETQADPSFFDREVNVRLVPTDRDQFLHDEPLSERSKRDGPSWVEGTLPSKPNERNRPIIPMHEDVVLTESKAQTLEEFKAECAEMIRRAEATYAPYEEG